MHPTWVVSVSMLGSWMWGDLSHAFVVLLGRVLYIVLLVRFKSM
jgi:hypothetical protein